MFHVIKKAVPEEVQRLRLRFADGSEGTVDLSDLIARGGVFARLGDSDAFSQVRIGGKGRWLEWPGDFDLCADALYESMQTSSGQRSAP